ncbi:hypothetical protein DICVIV_12060 [Dictyocaulus viviparus]|uniref:Uncharacterized protein n=1 Tax=Dictyocaulus viviparus TaxID=29172 RepID=A0A0D8XHZ4_DICVI|nr:hypothetical protein DICVIV_12060 [Dictyocaulus viviparus]
MYKYLQIINPRVVIDEDEIDERDFIDMRKEESCTSTRNIMKILKGNDEGQKTPLNNRIAQFISYGANAPTKALDISR